MAADALIAELKQAIAAGSVVVVAGTGVSVASVHGTPNAHLAGWAGLLLDGLDQCKALGLGSAGIIDATIAALKSAKPRLEDFLLAATQVETNLKAAGRYVDWLNDRVGKLSVRNPELIQAIGALGTPILTTNYDTLIAKELGRDSVAWTNHQQLFPVARGKARHVLHPHGLYTEAESVVLGWPSYSRVADDKRSTLLKQALAGFKTFLFVGCGVDGLTDPDLGPFFATYGALFGTGNHVRLCRQDEAAATPHGITVIAYDRHEELVPLLRRLAPVPDRHHTLERPPEPFVGRDAQRELLATKILAGEPVIVTGGPGMGKSGLCLAALHTPDVVARYGTRRWFVRLDGANDVSTMLAKVGEALGLPAEQRQPPRIRAALAEAPGALVLDNFETPWQADKAAAEEELKQLRAIAGLALVVAVRGHARPRPWLEIAIDTLPPPHDRALFLAWAGDRFSSDPTLPDLLGDLEGWTLALVQAAREAEGEPDLAGFRARWRAARTETGDVLGASLKLSIDSPRMSDDGRTLLSLLGRLPDGIARGDLDIVLPATGTKAANRLVQIGLADWNDNRLTVLAPIRQYLDKHHPPTPEHWAPCRDHYLGLLCAVDNGLSAPLVARLTPEIANTELTIGTALDDPGVAEDAAIATSRYGTFTRVTALGTPLPLLQRVVLNSNNRMKASCLLRIGQIASDRTDHASAEPALLEASKLFRRIDDRAGEADCQAWLGDLALLRNDWEMATEFYRVAGTGYRASEYRRGEANCLRDLGRVALYQGNLTKAEPLFRKSLKISRNISDLYGEANSLFNLAEIARQTINFSLAQKRLTEARRLFEAIANPQGKANCLKLESQIALAGGDRAAARTGLTQAQALYIQAGDLLGQGNCHLLLGECDRGDGDTAGARNHYLASIDLFQRIPDQYSIAMALTALARLSGKRERRTLVTQARAAWVELGLDHDVKALDAEFPDLAPPAG